MSPQIVGILGYQPADFVGDPELWPSRIHPDDRGAAIEAYEAHWRTGEPLRAEYRMIARDGTEIWVRDEAFAMADDTRSGRRVSQGLLVEITDRKRLESKLIHDALHDPLTGLANRVLLRDHLERALARHGRAPGAVALLFVDLDDFKQVNDSFGHAAGDQILCQVAERLGAAVRVTTSSAVRAATSSRCCSTGSSARTRRPSRRSGSCASCGGRSSWAAASWSSAARSGSPSRPSAGRPPRTCSSRPMPRCTRRSGAGKSTFAVFDAQMPVRTWTELEAAG